MRKRNNQNEPTKNLHTTVVNWNCAGTNKISTVTTYLWLDSRAFTFVMLYIILILIHARSYFKYEDRRVKKYRIASTSTDILVFHHIVTISVTQTTVSCFLRMNPELDISYKRTEFRNRKDRHHSLET